MPKLEPSPGVHPPWRGLELVTVESILIGFSLLIVGLRLITRFLIVKSPGWDDYAVILATVRWVNLGSHRTWVAELCRLRLLRRQV